MRINTGCFLNGCKCFDPEDEDGVGIKKDREWQGLTDDEITTIGITHQSLHQVARAIETKLKERNT